MEETGVWWTSDRIPAVQTNGRAGFLVLGGGWEKKKKMSSEMSGGKEGQLGRDSTQDEAGLAPGGISATGR